MQVIENGKNKTNNWRSHRVTCIPINRLLHFHPQVPIFVCRKHVSERWKIYLNWMRVFVLVDVFSFFFRFCIHAHFSLNAIQASSTIFRGGSDSDPDHANIHNCKRANGVKKKKKKKDKQTTGSWNMEQYVQLLIVKTNNNKWSKAESIQVINCSNLDCLFTYRNTHVHCLF